MAVTSKRSPDGAQRNPGFSHMIKTTPDFALLYPGYLLVSRVREWPYSSFHVYVRRGLLPADWAGDVEEPMMDFGERRG